MGNTIELKNIIERAVILADEEMLSIEQLPLDIRFPVHSTDKADYPDSLEEMEKEHIKRILEMNDWNKTVAAKKLGVGIPTLYRKIEQYGLSK
jgi:transcriptional regulator with PAS, ATPase and Fis domain